MEHEVTALVARFDADAVPASAVVPLHDQLQRIHRQVGAAITLLARRVDEVEQWKRAGYASAAEYVAAKSGSSVAAASDVLATSSKLTASAGGRGRVAGRAACRGRRRWRWPTRRRPRRGTGAAGQRRPTHQPGRTTPGVSAHQSRRRSRSGSDPGAHPPRNATCAPSPTPKGPGTCTCAAPSTRWPASKPALQPFIDDAFATEPGPKTVTKNERPTPSTRSLDWLDTVRRRRPARRAACARMLLLRVDLDALKRGAGRRRRVVRDPRGRAHLRRRRPQPVGRKHPEAGHHQRRRRRQRHPPRPRPDQRPESRVVVPTTGVHRGGLLPHPTRVRPPHPDWAPDPPHPGRRPPTRARYHHHQKTVHGWALVDGTGKRPMVPPDDPRHPNHTHRQRPTKRPHERPAWSPLPTEHPRLPEWPQNSTSWRCDGMAVVTKPGTSLRSVTCSTEVVIVRGPAEPTDLRCGGQPMVDVAAETAETLDVAAPFDGGTLVGKRYVERGRVDRGAVHEAGRRVAVDRRRRADGQGRQAAARVRLRTAHVHVGMILEMAADSLADRVAIGSARRRPDVRRARAPRAAGRDVACRARPATTSCSSTRTRCAVPIALFGAAIAGKPFVPVNYRLADDRLRAIVERTAPASVIVGDGVAERARRASTGIEIVEPRRVPAPHDRGRVDRRDRRLGLRSRSRSPCCCSPAARPVSRRRRCCAT